MIDPDTIITDELDKENKAMIENENKSRRCDVREMIMRPIFLCIKAIISIIFYHCKKLHVPSGIHTSYSLRVYMRYALLLCLEISTSFS
jgi:hypothetical protein